MSFTILNELIILIFIFIFGSIVGSFLNVCIYRLPRDKSIIFPPSSCPECGKRIKWHNNMPVFSYIFLYGRCADCRAKIPFRYFCIELLTAILAAALFLHFQNYYVSAYYFIFISALTVIFFIDLDYKEIYQEITYGFTLIGILGSCFLPKVMLGASNTVFMWHINNAIVCNLLNSLIGAALGAAFFWAIRFFGAMAFKQEAMGLGDVHLAMMIGAFLGPAKGFFSFFGAFFIGAVTAVLLMFFSKKGWKDEIAFGTFMAIGAVLAIFFADQAIALYINSMFIY